MATEKKKSVKSVPGRKVKVRVINQKQASLQELIDAKMGLYIPLNQLSADELALLENFLGNIKTEPIATAFVNDVASSFVKDMASAFVSDVASAFVVDAAAPDDTKK